MKMLSSILNEKSIENLSITLDKEVKVCFWVGLTHSTKSNTIPLFHDLSTGPQKLSTGINLKLSTITTVIKASNHAILKKLSTG